MFTPTAARPRLRADVAARRHLLGDGSAVVLHDGSRTLTLGEREWCVVRQMDGTRDLEGLERACAIAGRAVGREHLEAFVAQLDQLGLLAQGSDAPVVTPEPTTARDLPVVPMPGRRFDCDGSGGCCELYETMLATPVEAMRARALLPDHLDVGPHLEDAFTPEQGLRAPLYALPLGPRGCAYLEEDRRCALHSAGGAGAKPFGCQSHPIALLDVGHAIHAAPRSSCACAFEPAKTPLDLPSRGPDLDPRRAIARLGPTAAGGDSLSPRALLDWLAALPREGDVAERFERAADSLAPDSCAAPDLVRWAEARASRLLPHRPVQRVLAAVIEAAPRLGEGAPHEADEALYFETFCFLPAFEEASLEEALRARAWRVRLARAIAAPLPRPLAQVEALALGHALP